MVCKMLARLLPLSAFNLITQVLHLFPAHGMPQLLCLGRNKTSCCRFHQVRVVGTANEQSVKKIKGNALA